MKARSIARELALLGISQLPDDPQKVRRTAPKGMPQTATDQLSANQLDALLIKALKALSADVGEAIEAAEGELQRAERFILESETRTIEADKVRSRIEPSMPLVETAINRVGSTLDFLVFAQQGEKKTITTAQSTLEASASQLKKADSLLEDAENRIVDISEVRQNIQRAIALLKTAISDLRQALAPTNLQNLIERGDVRGYACNLIDHWINHWKTVDAQLDDAMEKWNVRRLARVDRDILRLAIMEIVYMDVPKSVAIDEAIEMAKRYSDEDSYRFINGVLRRTTDKLEGIESTSGNASEKAAKEDATPAPESALPEVPIPAAPEVAETVIEGASE